MKSGRAQGAITLPLIITLVIADAVILSIIFYSFFHKLNLKVETTLREQFNQQQLILSKKIADNVEAYFDYLKNELLAFPWKVERFELPTDPEFQNQFMMATSFPHMSEPFEHIAHLIPHRKADPMAKNFMSK